MSYSVRVPISSLVAGTLKDGSLSGQINESLHHAVISNVQLANNKYLLYMDKDKGAFYDLTSAINANQTVNPWGATSGVGAMNIGDGFLVACDDDISEIGLNIVTPGIGTWTGIEIYDSTNGTTFNRQITGFTDNTAALKSSGWNTIVLPAGSETGRVSLSPSLILDIASKKWILIKPVGISFTTSTAPQISGLYVKHNDLAIKWFNLTANSNGSLTVAPTGVNFHPSIGSTVAYFFDGLPVGWERYVFQQQANVRTRVIKYATNSAGTSFNTLSGVTDPSNDFTDIPATSPEKYSVRWTPPSDAAKVTRTFTMTDNTILNISGKYMFIIETTAVTSVAPIAPTLSRVRAKMLGDSGTSGKILSSNTIKRVSVQRHGTAQGSGAIAFQIYNFSTERSVEITFPDTDNQDIINIDIADVLFTEGHKIGLYHSSGSRIVNDIEFTFHT